MNGRAIPIAYRIAHVGDAESLLGGFSEKDFAQIVLQQERVGHPESAKQTNDVAVEQDRLPSARRRIRSMLEVHFVHDDVLRVLRLRLLDGTEESEKSAI